MAVRNGKEEALWYVLRDLQRGQATVPAYAALEKAKFEVFTPKKWEIRHSRRCQVPLIGDLLFVRSVRTKLDRAIAARPKLQYRFVRGGGYCEPMVVPTADMERFIHAVRSTDSPVYFTLGEITPEMCDRRIHIVGGTLDGYEGMLVSVSGSSVRRLLVTLPGFFAAGVKMEDADYVEFV